jgi:uroporphyrinogen-III decarboxylase
MKMDKSPQQLFEEREKRIFDAIGLRVPDRVPLNIRSGFFAAKYGGVTCKDLMYDRKKTETAVMKFMNDFQPDIGDNPFLFTYLGSVLETIGYKNLAWPGHGLDDMTSYQYIERVVMEPEEYDEYLFDPTDFVIRKIWPRIYSSLEPLEKLSPMQDVVEYVSNTKKFDVFADPAVQDALKSLMLTGEKVREQMDAFISFHQKLISLGYPTLIGGVSQAPFDYISDFFRGTAGIMLDMLRIPDKLLAMVEKMYPIMLRMGLSAKKTGLPAVFIPLHKCLNTFMSPQQFQTFFWPSLRRLIHDLIGEDLIPIVFWEGDCGNRLETIGDIPPGKAVYYFESTDIFRAKEILGDVVCLQGNVPLSMLFGGTPDDVSTYCKKLIDVVGKNGGFILSPASNIESANPENVRAMVQTTKTYGVY